MKRRYTKIKSYIKKPYMWVGYDKEYGTFYGFEKRVSTPHIYFPSKHLCFCGWDPDRNRWSCRPPSKIVVINKMKRIIPALELRTSWRGELYSK